MTVSEQESARASADQTLVAEGTDRESTPKVVTELARGDNIGRYLVLERLGSGGMGVVYSAYDPELDRKIAVKLLHQGAAGSSSSGGASRLLREAQAMARLSHPNVVTVHDVGTFRGHVFVAMEFVEGETLGAWLMHGPHSRAEVLDRFLRAGHGLAAAHAVGIVHRDFKPDNVLLGLDGRVRVADFGLARAEGSSAESADRVEPAILDSLSIRLTLTGARMGTPAYMAPEQHAGLEVGASADQFAFCVSLYEGLYGARPFRGDSLAALTFNVTQEQVSDAPPDSRVPARIRRLLLVGLRADPTRRHPSMDHLLAELARDPAGPRRRLLAGSAAVALLVGALFLVRTEPPPPPCAQAEHEFDTTWNDATREELTIKYGQSPLPYAVETGARVTQTLDDYAKQWSAARIDACEATHVRGEQSDSLLDLRIRCLERGRARTSAIIEILRTGDDKVIEGSLQTIESLYPLELCSDTEALLARVQPPDDPQEREQVEALRAEIDHVVTLRMAGQYREAMESAKPLVQRARTLGHPPVLAEALRAYGDLLDRNNDIKEAETVLDEAFVTAMACGHDEVMVSSASALVWLLGNHSTRWPEVDRWAALGEAALTHFGGDPKLAHALRTNLASSFRVRGEPSRALLLQTTLLDEARERTGEESQTFATALLNRATTEWKLGHYRAASTDFERAHQIFSATLGANHPKTISALNNDALARSKAGELPAAIASLSRVVEARIALRGPNDVEVADALGNLTGLRLEVGDIEGARRDESRALQIREAALGPDSADVAWSLANLALVEMTAGNFDAAQPLAERALDIFVATRGADHLETAGTHLIVARLHRLRGDFKSAKTEISATLAIQSAQQAPDHPTFIEPLIELAQIELGLKNPKQAQLLIERAAVLADQHAEASRERLGALEFTRARALPRDRLSEALEHARKAVDHFSSLAPVLGEQSRAEAQRWIDLRQPAAKL